MATTGVLEMLARADMDALLEDLRRNYRPGALEALTARDPAWRAEIDRVEQEVGSLYAALREADGTFTRWRRAVGELRRLWARVEGVEPSESGILEEVA